MTTETRRLQAHGRADLLDAFNYAMDLLECPSNQQEDSPCCECGGEKEDSESPYCNRCEGQINDANCDRSEMGEI